MIDLQAADDLFGGMTFAQALADIVAQLGIVSLVTFVGLGPAFFGQAIGVVVVIVFEIGVGVAFDFPADGGSVSIELPSNRGRFEVGVGNV